MPEEIKGKINVGCGKDQKAFLVETEAYGEIWIPKSQIAWEKYYNIRIWITDWIAWQKGIITEEEYNKRIGTNKIQDQEQSDLPF